MRTPITSNADTVKVASVGRDVAKGSSEVIITMLWISRPVEGLIISMSTHSL